MVMLPRSAFNRDLYAGHLWHLNYKPQQEAIKRTKQKLKSQGREPGSSPRLDAYRQMANTKEGKGDSEH